MKPKPDPAGGIGAQAALEAIREGYRARDPARVAAAYAEDAECTIVNRNHPPSRPLVIRGRAALQELLRDICAREMTHEIVEAAFGESTLSYRVECRYPDGCKVVGLYHSTLRGGRIVREFSIDCWDE
jgi:nuclear transport factor 2 (NTF2) superfamily protein